MRNIWLFRLISMLSVLTTVAVFYILFPEKTNDKTCITAVILLAAMIGYLFYIPVLVSNNKTETSMIGTFGTRGFFTVILIIWAMIAVCQALAGNQKTALAMSCITVTGFVIVLAVVKVTADALNDVSQKINYKSSQPIWGSQLSKFGSLCIDSELRATILKLAEDTIYLARDTEGSGEEINGRITLAIQLLENFSASGNKEAAFSQVEQIRALFVQRETQLKNSRSKV